MAGIEISVDVTRDDISPALRALARRMGSIRRPLAEMGRGLVTSTRKRFESAYGPVIVGNRGVATAWLGAKWKPLADATIARRRKHSSKPLMDTTTLMRSITSQATHDAIHVGTNHEIAPGVSAAIHQLGGKAGRNHAVTIPARPFLFLAEENKAQLKAFVIYELKKRGFFN